MRPAAVLQAIKPVRNGKYAACGMQHPVSPLPDDK